MSVNVDPKQYTAATLTTPNSADELVKAFTAIGNKIGTDSVDEAVRSVLQL